MRIFLKTLSAIPSFFTPKLQRLFCYFMYSIQPDTGKKVQFYVNTHSDGRAHLRRVPASKYDFSGKMINF